MKYTANQMMDPSSKCSAEHEVVTMSCAESNLQKAQHWFLISPIAGIPKALLGHCIVKEHRRPVLPIAMPQELKDLIQACWNGAACERCVAPRLEGC